MFNFGKESCVIPDLDSYLDLEFDKYKPCQEPKRALLDVIKIAYIECKITRCDACFLIDYLNESLK